MDSPAEKPRDVEHRTIFHEILDSKLPPQEINADRLSNEAFAIVAAGTLTTAWTMAVAVYYILENPSILKNLRNELRTAIPDQSTPPTLTVLEQLPYLKGIVQEALRLSDPVMSRQHRIPHEPLLYTDPLTSKKYVIPAGTPCSSHMMLIHRNPTIFPEPGAFRPERWIENPRLDKYLVSFSRGTRICLGMNLAFAEMYLVLTGIFMRHGTKECMMEGDEGWLELFETERRDVICVSDKNVPGVWEGSKGVRVKIVPVGA